MAVSPLPSAISGKTSPLWVAKAAGIKGYLLNLSHKIDFITEDIDFKMKSYLSIMTAFNERTRYSTNTFSK